MLCYKRIFLIELVGSLFFLFFHSAEAEPLGFDFFSAAVNKALQKLQEDMMKMQQEQANKIVTPDELRGGNDLII